MPEVKFEQSKVPASRRQSFNITVDEMVTGEVGYVYPRAVVFDKYDSLWISRISFVLRTPPNWGEKPAAHYVVKCAVGGLKVWTVGKFQMEAAYRCDHQVYVPVMLMDGTEESAPEVPLPCRTMPLGEVPSEPALDEDDQQ